jgi:hypothetical protein
VSSLAADFVSRRAFARPQAPSTIRLSRLKYWLETLLMLVSTAWIIFAVGFDPLVQGIVWALAVPMVLTRVRALVLMGQLLRDQRLQIGEDRLQLLERTDEVLGDIPFAEIEDAVVPNNGPYAGRLMITLFPREGEPTCWPVATWPRRTYLKRFQGREVIIIEPFFAEGSARINERLLDRLDRYIDRLVYYSASSSGSSSS